MIRVGANLHSGLLSFSLLPGEIRRVDKAMTGKLRAMMMDGATFWGNDGGYVAMSSLEVWKWWRLAPTAIELLTQRLRWIQNMARFPSENFQILMKD